MENAKGKLKPLKPIVSNSIQVLKVASKSKRIVKDNANKTEKESRVQVPKELMPKELELSKAKETEEITSKKNVKQGEKVEQQPSTVEGRNKSVALQENTEVIHETPSKQSKEKKEAFKDKSNEESPVMKDRGSKCPLQIIDLCPEQIPASGNQKIVLLCSMLSPGDKVQVCIKEDSPEDPNSPWEVRLSADQVTIAAHGGAITFMAPPYSNPETSEAISAGIFLIRDSDGLESEKVSLKYLPSTTITSSQSRDDSEPLLAEDLNDSQTAPCGSNNTGGEDSNLPRVLDSYSISDMPMDDSEILGDKWNSSTPEAVNKALVTARALLKTLTAERETNKTLADNDAKYRKEIQDFEEEKARLLSENEKRGSEIERLKGSLEKLEVRILEQTASKKSEQNELVSSLLLEKKTVATMRSENKDLLTTNQQLRSELRDQGKGVENLIWQLDQKEAQVRALEKRLRETFPLLPQASSAGVTSEAATAESVSKGPSDAIGGSSSSSGESCDEVRLKRLHSPCEGGSSTRSKRRRK